MYPGSFAMSMPIVTLVPIELLKAAIDVDIEKPLLAGNRLLRLV